MNKSLDNVRARFDSAAAEWDSNPGRVALARAVVAAIRNVVKLRPDMSVMDFGAGTGLITLGLVPYVASITAVDTSSEMLRMLDQKLKVQQVRNVRTLHRDIADVSRLPVEFDLIVSSMVLHHIQDVPQVLQQLRSSLRPGGFVALADLESEDGSFHTDPTGVYHRGFDRLQVCRWLQAAGFTATEAREAHQMVRTSSDGKNRIYPVFLVTGRAD